MFRWDAREREFGSGFADCRRRSGDGSLRVLWLLVVPGRIALACFLMARSYLLHDERFVIPSSSSIGFEGNAHVTRAQLLSIFGEDVERNIFTVSLEQRRAELERLPWVAHATVMRLLPNRMRVSIVERTPVAFVRQGSRIGLVDANGVLLDMPVDAKTSEHYSFPVVTGISADEPLSTRAARMKIYERFTVGAGWVGGEDLGGAERGGSFESGGCEGADSGATRRRYWCTLATRIFWSGTARFKEHLAEWRTLYPKLSSVDMRYERQVVLQMPPGSGAPAAAARAGMHCAGCGCERCGDRLLLLRLLMAAKLRRASFAADRSGAKLVLRRSCRLAAQPRCADEGAASASRAGCMWTAQSETAFAVPAKKQLRRSVKRTCGCW